MRDSKKGRTDLQQKRVRRYKFIEKESRKYPLSELLKVAKVSRSAYYAWLARGADADVKKAEIRTAVKDKFYFHKRTYGSKRLSDELKDAGVKAGRKIAEKTKNVFPQFSQSLGKPKAAFPHSHRPDC